jgi:hypothetical protein
MNAIPASMVVLLLALPSTLLAGDAEIKRDVKAKVEILNDATMKGEYGKIADLTHPKVLEIVGGREKMIALMEKTIQQLKGQGIEILSTKVAEPSDLVKQGEELYVVVSFELKMKLKDGKMTTFGYVIGVSNDQGKTWTFVNSSSNLEAIKQILPNLPAALKLPEPKKPILEKG